MKKPKRLYHKKIVAVSAKMNADIKAFCRDKNIESESELIRTAVSKYIYSGFKDVTLNRHILSQIQNIFANCRLTVSFSADEKIKTP